MSQDRPPASSPAPSSAGLSPEKRALIALREMRSRLEALEAARAEPIAIVGMSCRFPGASSTSEFWELLASGGDAVTTVPGERWDAEALHDPDPRAPGKMVTTQGGFVAGAADFDPSFFGVSPREATLMDPQQRLLLELAYEAIADSGTPLARLRKVATGVFVGVFLTDYTVRTSRRLDRIEGHFSTNTHSIVSNRLSYSFDLRGPSMSIDTACSSSLVAVHVACQSLRSGESNVAIAGGVHLLMTPEFSISFSKFGMLSKRGRCRTFDASADGYVRGEGCGVLVLKRLSDAIRDGDRVHALIRGSAVAQDGHTAGITAPNPVAQQELIEEALRRANVAPKDVSYVEAHGTGTPLGDPIELSALGAALANGRPPGSVCSVGSVKTNIGHLESAAGIAGIIKTVLALKHRRIPPSIHFREPNPHIPFDRLPLRVQTRLDDWAGPNRVAGISSFGYGGTIAHVVVSEATPMPSEPFQRGEERAARGLPEVFTLSAKTPEALSTAVGAMLEQLEREPASSPSSSAKPITYRDEAYTSSARRDHFAHRLAVVARSREELRELLSRHSQEGAVPGKVETGTAPDTPPRIAFVYTGQGPQWFAMGRELLASEPAFAEALTKVDAHLRECSGWSVVDELGAEEHASRLGETAFAQPAIFALQVALTAYWAELGVKPDVVVGHSVGEIAAVTASGALSLDEAARLVVTRGRVMQQATGRGKMAAVALPAMEAEELVRGRSDVLAVAAANAPSSSVIAGESRAVDDVVLSLQARGVDVQVLPVNYAFHSPTLDPLVAELERSLGVLDLRESDVRVVSTVTGDVQPGATFDARYWARQMRQRVDFDEAIRTVLRAGCTVFVEIGPHPVLSAYVASIARAEGKQAETLASLRRKHSEPEQLLTSAARLHCLGYPIDWAKRFERAPGRVATLPAYPWQHRRFLLEAAPAQQRRLVVGHDGKRREAHPLLDQHVRPADRSSEDLFETELGYERMAWLAEHGVRGTRVAPGAFYVSMAVAAGRELFGDACVGLRDVRFTRMLVPAEEGTKSVQLVVDRSDVAEPAFALHSSVLSGEERQIEAHADGRLLLDHDPEKSSATGRESLAAVRTRCERPELALDADIFYARWHAVGVEHGKIFRGVAEVWHREGEALLRVESPEGARHELGSYGIHPVPLDICFQALAALLPAVEGTSAPTYVPAAASKLRFGREQLDPAWIHVRLREGEPCTTKHVDVDIVAFDGAGRVVFRAEGFRYERAGRAVTQARVGELLYDVAWKSKARGDAAPATGCWLVLEDRGGVSAALVRQLEARGARVVAVAPGDAFRGVGDRYVVPAGDRAALARVLREAIGEGESWNGIVHAWALDVAPTHDADGLAEVGRIGMGSALALVQAIAEVPSAEQARVWLVSQGAVAVEEGSSVRPEQALLYGFAASASLELRRHRLTLVDLPAAQPDGVELASELLSVDDGERRVVLRRGGRWVARLVRSSSAAKRRSVALAEHEAFALSIESSPASLVRATRSEPGEGEVEIAVGGASAVGSRGEVRAIAGKVVRAGVGVSSELEGRTVVAVGSWTLRSHALARVEALVVVDERTALDHLGALLPAAAAVSIFRFACRCRPGERALVALPEGRVREVFEVIAKALELTVATAPSAPERPRAVPVDIVVTNDRSRVDDVALAPYARVVELGDHAPTRDALLDASRLLAEAGTPPRITLSLADFVARAQEEAGPRLDASVVEIPPTVAFDESVGQIRADATYVISGGLGSLGLVVAERLAEAGARTLVLIGRRAPNDDARAAIARLTARGVDVRIESADVSSPAEVAQVLARLASAPPVRGVVHAAGVLDDGVLSNLDGERLVGPVLLTKAKGAAVLARAATSLPLDFIVFFSSTASALGAAGQANYAAANAYLDALAHDLRARGHRATSIHWGPWAGGGLAARADRQAHLARQHLRPISQLEGATLFAEILQRDPTEIVAADVATLGASELYGNLFDDATTARDADLVARRRLSAVLVEVAPEERKRLVHELVRSAWATALRAPLAQVTPTATFKSLGVDSMLMLEVKNTLEAELGIAVSVIVLINYPTVAQLADHLLSLVPAGVSAAVDTSVDTQGALATTGGAPAAPFGSEVDQPLEQMDLEDLSTLSEDQMDALLSDEAS